MDGADGASSNSSTAALLVEIALRDYRLGRTTKNEPFAVPIRGAQVIRHLHDKGAGSLRAELSKVFWQQEGRVATASALSDALQASAVTQNRPVTVDSKAAS